MLLLLTILVMLRFTYLIGYVRANIKQPQALRAALADIHPEPENQIKTEAQLEILHYIYDSMDVNEHPIKEFFNWKK